MKKFKLEINDNYTFEVAPNYRNSEVYEVSRIINNVKNISYSLSDFKKGLQEKLNKILESSLHNLIQEKLKDKEYIKSLSDKDFINTLNPRTLKPEKIKCLSFYCEELNLETLSLEFHIYGKYNSKTTPIIYNLETGKFEITDKQLTDENLVNIIYNRFDLKQLVLIEALKTNLIKDEKLIKYIQLIKFAEGKKSMNFIKEDGGMYKVTNFYFNSIIRETSFNMIKGIKFGRKLFKFDNELIELLNYNR
jgi:hypothetical protein